MKVQKFISAKTVSNNVSASFSAHILKFWIKSILYSLYVKVIEHHFSLTYHNIYWS